MNNRVYVVEAIPRNFSPWEDSRYGLAAQINVLGNDSSALDIRRIGTAEELRDIAIDVNRSSHIPARALVFQNFRHPGSDLETNPINIATGAINIDRPADYETPYDIDWVVKGDTKRPLSPYARLICNRLVKRLARDVRYTPTTEEYADPESVHDLFHFYPKRDVHDDLLRTYSPHHRRLIPHFGGFLARINRHLVQTGQDFMALVDGVSEQTQTNKQDQIVGADIVAHAPVEEDLLVELPDDCNFRLQHTIRRIGLIARLMAGDYPGGTSEKDAELILPRHEDM